MTRFLYGGTAADITTSKSGRVVPGADGTAWFTRAGDDRAYDLVDIDGSGILEVTSDANAQVLFYGPDDYDGPLWLDFGLGYRTMVRSDRAPIPGPANSLSVGTVTTGPAGSPASITISGDAPDQVLDASIPRGDTSDAPDTAVLTAFGADPAGLADSSEAVTAALAASIAGTGRTVKASSGTYLLDGTATRVVQVPAGKRWALIGDPGAVFKMADGAITADNIEILQVVASGGDVEKIDIADVSFDMNRRGQDNPVDPYEWEHCATIIVGSPSGTPTNRLRNVSLRNLDFIDPVADCVYVPRYYVDTLQIDNMTVRDRAGTRGDIQLSGLPRLTQISNFSGYRIESEPLSIPAGVTHDFLVQINNADCAKVMDLYGPDAPDGRVQFRIVNSRAANLYMYHAGGYMRGCEITYPLTNTSRRLQYLWGFTFDDCDFYLTADSAGAIAPINVWPESVMVDGKPLPNRVKFRNCRFHVVPETGYTGSFTGRALEFAASQGASIGSGLTVTASTDTVNKTAHGLPAGTRVVVSSRTGGDGLVVGQTMWVVNPTADAFQLAATRGGAAVDITTDGTCTARWFTDVDFEVEGCWFDDRFPRSVHADRSGNLLLKDNDYAGGAIYLVGSLTYEARYTIEGGRWDRATSFLAVSVIAGASSLTIRDVHLDARLAAHSVVEGTMASWGRLSNDRILFVDAPPSSQPGITGDRARLRVPVAGAVCEWVCTASSATTATWKATTTAAA